MKNEFELINRLKKIIPNSIQGHFKIGDDAAVLPILPQESILLSADALVEGKDFIFKKTEPELVGRKALACNLSDLAAMGGRPLGFVVTLGIPGKVTMGWIHRFYDGMMPLARKYKASCAGGDVSEAREFFVSITILGKVKNSCLVTRRGAQVGDWIGVTGKLGGSILGRHLTFEPRLREAAFLAQQFKPRAMIDISDGFLQDLEHILKDSKVGARLDLEALPVSQAAKKLARGKPRKVLEHALTDGEDFELLFTLAPRKKAALDRAWKKEFPNVPLSWVGRIQKGELKLPFKLKKHGYSHF